MTSESEGEPERTAESGENSDSDESDSGDTPEGETQTEQQQDSDSDDESDSETPPETLTEVQPEAQMPETPTQETLTEERLETQIAATPVTVSGSTLGDEPNSQETSQESRTEQPQPAPVQEISTNKTVVSGVTDEQQEEYIMVNPQIKTQLTDELIVFVNKSVFPLNKFRMTEEEEIKYCRIAAFEEDVKLPEGVTRQTFGMKFHKTVRKRMNDLRANAHSSMKEKYDSKFFQMAWLGLTVDCRLTFFATLQKISQTGRFPRTLRSYWWSSIEITWMKTGMSNLGGRSI